MLFDMNGLTGPQRYKLLTSSITPRPIAWVTSRSAAGTLNAAPFSCFNMMGHTPPMIVLGLQQRHDGSYKDTCANILATGELVVNLVTESDAEAMNFTSAEAPPEFDEVAAANIGVTASLHVSPPRISTAPVSFECRTFQVIRPGPQQTIILGEVLAVHVNDAFVLDADRLLLDTPRMRLIGRMHSPGWYARCTDLLQIMPPNLAKP
jgi:flavin reductase (DIM6/NTAB) family NADH-FMN oxidoreductase RutF